MTRCGSAFRARHRRIPLATIPRDGRIARHAAHPGSAQGKREREPPQAPEAPPQAFNLRLCAVPLPQAVISLSAPDVVSPALGVVLAPLHSLAVFACPVLLLSVAACSTDPSHDGPKPPKPGAPSAPGGLALVKAVDQLKAARENRSGYTRDAFKLWVDADHNGRDARQEVLLAEAVKKPCRGKDCKLTGGQWTSYCDGKTVNDPTKLDIDHVVPLAEAWDSGASKWTAKRREAYATGRLLRCCRVAAAPLSRPPRTPS
ncbi:hypothetical protein [Streptomyces rimosus]|uniref:hypothetical protein n=1 Tax=Streptomyces rimosus TaxID=1927 RepID=UPI0018FED059